MISSVQLATAFLHIPGKIFGSEVRPRKYNRDYLIAKCDEAAMVRDAARGQVRMDPFFRSSFSHPQPQSRDSFAPTPEVEPFSFAFLAVLNPTRSLHPPGAQVLVLVAREHRQVVGEEVEPASALEALEGGARGSRVPYRIRTRGRMWVGEAAAEEGRCVCAYNGPMVSHLGGVGGGSTAACN